LPSREIDAQKVVDGSLRSELASVIGWEVLQIFGTGPWDLYAGLVSRKDEHSLFDWMAA
jgi:hypothetical protein